MGLSFSHKEPHKRTQLPAHEGAIPLGGDIAISAEGDRLKVRPWPTSVLLMLSSPDGCRSASRSDPDGGNGGWWCDGILWPRQERSALKGLR